MGAKGVDVGGTLYDVTFGDGVLGNSISSFTDSVSASLASQSLIDQVFSGFFDTSLGINGISTYYISVTTAGVVTPYSITTVTKRGIVIPVVNTVQSSIGKDQTSAVQPSTFVESTADTTLQGATTIATWTPSATATAVPEPEAYAMMLAGLGLVGFAARRKQQAA